MIRVAITRFLDGGRGEHTEWTHMPQVPSVGSSIKLSDDIPIQYVRYVTWVSTEMLTNNDAGYVLTWHAEITVGTMPV